MKKSSLSLALIAFSFVLSSKCFAATSGSSNLTYTVPAVSVLTVSGNVTFPAFGTPVAGSDFTGLTDASTTYSVTNNAGAASRKVTVQLGAALPSGVGLSGTLAAPTGATSAGVTSISSTSAVAVVTAIGNGAYPNNTITYNLVASVATAAVATATLALTYTLTA